MQAKKRRTAKPKRKSGKRRSEVEAILDMKLTPHASCVGTKGACSQADDHPSLGTLSLGNTFGNEVDAGSRTAGCMGESAGHRLGLFDCLGL